MSDMEENKKSTGFMSNLKAEMKEFYKNKLKTKHMWFFAIGLFIYFTMLIAFKTGAINIDEMYTKAVQNVNVYSENNIYGNEVDISTSIQKPEVKEVTRIDSIKQQFLLCLVSIITGFAPYIYVPVLVAIVYPVTYAATVSKLSILFVILLSITAIIEIYLMSLIVSLGIYICKMSTNHLRYSNSSSLSFNDVRLQFNEAMKKEENIEKIKKKMEEKREKLKSLNEKTNYKMVLVFFVICTFLMEIVTLITGV